MFHIIARKFMRAYTEDSWSPWSPPDIPPAYVGWYQVRGGKDLCRYWDGAHWMLSDASANEKQKDRSLKWSWRGLKVKPRKQGEQNFKWGKAMAATSSLFRTLGVKSVLQPVQLQFRRTK